MTFPHGPTAGPSTVLSRWLAPAVDRFGGEASFIPSFVEASP
ncbi:hypothetical protein [Myxococcus stipitatus]|nr:hypothetical protein [Myxococcus stipitatus]